MARNLELKARDPDPAASRRACAGLGATVAGELRQRDTYFRVRAGRLKLREAEGRPAELIAYARADRPEARLSEYTVVPVPDPAALRGALAGTLGVLAVVEKVRELRLWRGVRIHLDDVTGLGRFVELEAVLAPEEAPEDAAPRVAQLRGVLAIADAALEPRSYLDLVLARGPCQPG